MKMKEDFIYISAKVNYVYYKVISSISIHANINPINFIIFIEISVQLNGLSYICVFHISYKMKYIFYLLMIYVIFFNIRKVYKEKNQQNVILLLIKTIDIINISIFLSHIIIYNLNVLCIT